MAHREAAEFRRRWADVNALELERSRLETTESKLRTLGELSEFLRSLPSKLRDQKSESTIRDRWARLHQALRGRA